MRKVGGGTGDVKMEVASWHIRTLPPLDSVYIWTGLSSFTLTLWWVSGLHENSPLHSRHYAPRMIVHPRIFCKNIVQFIIIPKTSLLMTIISLKIWTLFTTFLLWRPTLFINRTSVNFFLFPKFLPVKAR